MSCPGLHCPGCSEGQSLGIVGVVVIGPVVADKVCTWVAEHIWWIGGTLAISFAVATAVSMALEAWADHRGARFAAVHGILSRADVILPDRGRSIDAPADLPALGFRDLHIHLDGVPAAEQAQVIRRALGRN